MDSGLFKVSVLGHRSADHQPNALGLSAKSHQVVYTLSWMERALPGDKILAGMDDPEGTDRESQCSGSGGSTSDAQVQDEPTFSVQCLELHPGFDI